MLVCGSFRRLRRRAQDYISPLPLAATMFLLALVWVNRDLIPFHTAEFDYHRLRKQESALTQKLAEVRREYMRLVKEGLYPEAEKLRSEWEEQLAVVEKGYREFLSAHPHHLRAMTAFGNFLEENGREHEASQWWARVVQLSPKDPHVLNNLANYYGHNGEAARAIRLYEEAIRLNPTEAVYHFNLGNMYYLFRKETEQIHGWDLDQIFREALNQFRIARDLEPNNFEYASAYAETFYGVNFLKERIAWEEALKAWEYCLNMNLDSGQKDYVKVHLVRLNLYTGKPLEAARSASEIRSEELRQVARNLLNRMYGPPIRSPYSA